jgi:hypothetical protein
MVSMVSQWPADFVFIRLTTVFHSMGNRILIGHADLADV